jgi:hypothetical protein
MLWQFFVYIIIILLIIRVIKKIEIYEWQRATDSGVEQTRHCQWRLCVKQCKRATGSDTLALGHLFTISLPLDQHYYCHQRRYWQWRIYKDATTNSMFTLFYTKTSLTVVCFTPRYYQWCAKFQILLLSLLLLII